MFESSSNQLKKALSAAAVGGNDPQVRSATHGFDPLDELLDKNQAAGFFRITVRTLELWMRQGLPYYRIHRSIRFRRRHLLNYLEQKCKN